MKTNNPSGSKKSSQLGKSLPNAPATESRRADFLVHVVDGGDELTVRLAAEHNNSGKRTG